MGVPGAANWREDRDAQHLDGIEKIYVVIEPDRGGEAVRKWISQSAIRAPGATGHAASQRCIGPASGEPRRVQDPLASRLRLGRCPGRRTSRRRARSRAIRGLGECADLARSHAILELLDSELTGLGVVGERRGAKLLYLALTSRLLERPVSVVVKGPSSGGKSYVTESVLKLFPPSAFYALTAMSDRALAYSNEPLKHRHLVIYEAAGMSGEFATYLIRSLLSEGRLRYETVEKTKDGLAAEGNRARRPDRAARDDHGTAPTSRERNAHVEPDRHRYDRSRRRTSFKPCRRVSALMSI